MKRRRKEIERYLAEEALRRRQELTSHSDASVSHRVHTSTMQVTQWNICS
jgi:hypothetical protein